MPFSIFASCREINQNERPAPVQTVKRNRTPCRAHFSKFSLRHGAQRDFRHGGAPRRTPRFRVCVGLPRPRSTILIASDVRVMWAPAYLGLVRRRYQSGEIDYTGSISRCGDGRLRMGGSASGHRLLPAWSSAAYLVIKRTADDVARQGSDAQQRLRTARSGVCRARPSRAKHAVAPRYNRRHISQGFVEGAPR
jgi:hypothetical protein